MLSSVFMRDKRDASSRSPGQSALLHAVRLRENKDIGAVIKKASVEDLVWFLQMLDYQLEETPNWVHDKSQLHDIQAWTRRVRTMTAEVLHNKRVKARPRAWLLRVGESLFFVILGVVLGFALTRYYG